MGLIFISPIQSLSHKYLMKIFFWPFGSGWSFVIQRFVEQKNQMIKILAWSGRGYVQWVPNNIQTVAGRSEGTWEPLEGLRDIGAGGGGCLSSFHLPGLSLPIVFP